MDEPKHEERRSPRVPSEELLRNPSEIMRLAELPGGVYLTNEKGEDSEFIWIPMEELPPSSTDEWEW